MQISSNSDSVASLNGSVSFDEVAQLRQELEVLIDSKSGASLNLDVSGLDSINSVVLSIFLCSLRYAKAASCKLCFVNVQPKLFDSIRVGGLESIIPISE